MTVIRVTEPGHSQAVSATCWSPDEEGTWSRSALEQEQGPLQQQQQQHQQPRGADLVGGEERGAMLLKLLPLRVLLRPEALGWAGAGLRLLPEGG